jgi:hypothetical protein
LSESIIRFPFGAVGWRQESLDELVEQLHEPRWWIGVESEVGADAPQPRNAPKHASAVTEPVD